MLKSMPVTTKSPRRGDEVDVDGPDRIPVGTVIEVRTRFDGHWARGFEVATTDGQGYRVRRQSDGRELPAQFSDQDVRLPRERKRGTWWY
jgi:hypothetical protein